MHNKKQLVFRIRWMNEDNINIKQKAPNFKNWAWKNSQAPDNVGSNEINLANKQSCVPH